MRVKEYFFWNVKGGSSPHQTMCTESASKNNLMAREGGSFERDRAPSKSPLIKGDSGFAETARGLSCLGSPKLPGQPPRPTAFAPFFKGDLAAGPLL